MNPSLESSNFGQASDLNSISPVIIQNQGSEIWRDSASHRDERLRVMSRTAPGVPIVVHEQDGSIFFLVPNSDASLVPDRFTRLGADELKSTIESADAIREATGQDNWIARWTDVETIDIILKEKNASQRALLSDVYEELYGISLADELRKNMSGATCDLAINLLNRKDGDVIDQAAGTIHTDLIDLNQMFFGRKRSELETEIRNIIASKNSEEIAELDKVYRAKYGVGLRDAIMSDKKMSQETKDAIDVYLKGADGRNDADAMRLADAALRSKNITRFQEAMRDASAEARRQFLNDGGSNKILEAFGSPNYYDQTDGRPNFLSTVNSINALEYAEHGKLSAAQQVRDNTGVFHFTSNTRGIEAAIVSMEPEERSIYQLGKLIQESGAQVLIEPLEAEKAKAFYTELHGAMVRVGNGTEILAWEDQIAHKGGSLVTALAKHRGTIYDDSVSDMCATVENMKESDWRLLKDPIHGKVFRQEIEAMLRTYASDSETKRVMSIVDKKSAQSTFSEAAEEHRSILEALDDRTHWFKPNDSDGMLNDISNMSNSEQESYRNDAEFRKLVDRSVEDKLRGSAEDAARGLLQKVLGGTKPVPDLVTQLQMRAGSSISPWARVQAERRDLERAFQEDNTLQERIKNPKTEEDIQLSRKIRELTSQSMSKKEFEDYIQPLLETGSSDPEKLMMLDIMCGEREAIFADLANAPVDRRLDLLSNLSQSQLSRFFNKKELAVVENVLKQGSFNAEDSIRAKIVGWGQKDEIMTELRAMNPAQIEELKKQYAIKYSDDLIADLVEKLGGERQLEAEKILLGHKLTDAEKVNDLMQQGSKSHSGFGAGFVDGVGNVGTGYQIDDAINRTVGDLAEAAKTSRELSSEEWQAMQEEIETANRNYRESKTSVADTTVNVTMAAAAVGGAAFTGGTSLGLLAGMIPVGAAVKLGEKALILGADYDASTDQVASDLVTGGAYAAAALSGGQLGAAFGVEAATMGVGTEIGLSALAGGLGQGTAAFAGAVMDEQNGDQIAGSTFRGAVTGALLAGGMSAGLIGVRKVLGSLRAAAPDDAQAFNNAEAGIASGQADAGVDALAPRTGDALADALTEGARFTRDGRELWAMCNLTNADEIAEFVRTYNSQYPGVALKNLQFASQSNLFAPGTQEAWKSAIDGLRAQQGIPLAPAAPAATADAVDAPAAPAAVANSADEVRVVKVDAPAPAIAPEISESVARSQGMVNAAAKSEAVIPMKKQLYSVRFEQVTEPGGRMVQTLENRITGEMVPQGKWIATRLDAAGMPVIEDGIVNSWPMEAAKVAKTYNVTVADLQATTRLIAQTRVDGPIVHMVQLREPTTIMSKWGPLSGKAGDWLANYDFNPATGQAGKEYAIITAKSYSQTYQPVN